MISIPNHPRLTLTKALELLRELDFYAGKLEGGSNGKRACIESTREALASHIAESLARKGKRK